MGILDILFPKYCVQCKKFGSYLCANCFSFLSFSESGTCAICNRPCWNELTHPSCKNRYAILGVFASIKYQGVAKKLIYQFKYKPYLSDLQNTLVDLLYEGLIQKELFHKAVETNPLVVPIPLHLSRERKRGYNQSEILAQGLAKRFKLQVKHMLTRVKKTQTQTGLDKKKRKENIENAFSIAPNILISRYPHIFLVDDVVTTGSTMQEAAKILLKNGAKKVWGIALARD